ncbi:MAG: DUF4347 domain-containing protein [Cyanothece sp. SIO2G6]|nr:DUF4347 domain-containing protein [Cyanothece sp. SIO2G6]
MLKVPTSTAILFIDAAVSDIATLTANVKPGIQVYLLNAYQDGIEQITDVLQNLNAPSQDREVHIVAHGSPGTLHLGNSELSLSTLDRYTPALKSWFTAAPENSPISPLPHSPISKLNLYACNVAAGDAGEEFITKLHHLTNAHIAASTTQVGNRHLGGTWNLDFKTQNFVTELPLTVEALVCYQSVLAIIPINTLIANYVSLPDAPDQNYVSGVQSYSFRADPVADNLEIEGFTASVGGVNESFTFVQLASEIRLQRADNPGTDFEREIFWYEGTGAINAPNIDLSPERAFSLEEALLSNVINRGSDNVFANNNTTNTNNIERVDFISAAGLSASADLLDDVGFLIMERGGNDDFQIAPITEIGLDGNPSEYGALQTIGAGTWGNSQFSLETVVLNEQTNGTEPVVSDSLGAQPIAGIFIPFSELGIAADETFFGYSIFPNDVNAGADLTDFENPGIFPRNTNDGGAGGLDLVAGGAVYARNDVLPTASDDSSIGNTPGTAVTLNVLTNDNNGDPLNPATVDLDPSTPGIDSTLIVPGEGTWTVDPTGLVTFTPQAGFTGDPTDITYTVKNNSGLASNPATISVDYIQTPPIATDDSSTGNPTGTPVTLDVLNNDTDDGTLNPATVDLDPTTPGIQSELSVPGQGTWRVDLTTGAVTFTPESGFTGDPTDITYTVQDNDGLTSAPATISVDYIQQTLPVVTDDSSTDNAIGTPVTLDVLGNDPDNSNLNPATVDLDPSTPGIQTELSVPGEGIWSVNPTTGAVTFTPESGFTGDPTDITYTVQDNDGQTSNPATISVDYTQTSPIASPDTDTDGDGVLDTDDIDDDNDGILDVDEGDGNLDTDGDGVPDSLDLDADNDGILDVQEAGHNQPDANGDGIVDGPVGANGFPDAVETTPESGVPSIPVIDTDGDGSPDFQDLDADNDGVSDLIERGGLTDANDDDRADGGDFDGDGLLDVIDGSNGAFGTGSVPMPLDSDSNGIPDFQQIPEDGKPRGSSGPDNVIGTEGDDILSGFSDLDLLDGFRGNDIISGGSQVDRLIGGPGHDIINGGTNEDRIVGNDGRDFLNGGGGNDRMFGNNGNDVMNGGTGNDRIRGGNGRDRIDGGDGNDKIFGQRGRDTIAGGKGNDLIVGGLGRDILTGGGGRDTFRYTSVREFGDRIIDFEIITDVIDLRPINGISSMDDLNLIQRGDNALIRVQVDNRFRTVANLNDIDVNDLDQGNFRL